MGVWAVPLPVGGAAALGAGVAEPAGEALAGTSVEVAAMWEGLVVGAGEGGLLLGPGRGPGEVGGCAICGEEAGVRKERKGLEGQLSG